MKQHLIDKYILDPRHKLTISVFGVGGTGSFLLSKLARLNIALQKIHDHPGLHVTAYDYDIIEDHNYVRSTFSPADAGLPKATTIISRINRYYGLKWKGFDRKFIRQTDESTNIIFLCVDSLDSRKEIIEDFPKSGYDWTKHLYTFDIGNGDNYGQVIISSTKNVNVHSGSSKSLNIHKYAWDLFDIKEEADKPSCSMEESLSAQSLFINEFMAIVAAETFKNFILSPKITSNAIFVNSEDLTINKGFIE
jgi:PRTRC genetic system ThiF family protein